MMTIIKYLKDAIYTPCRCARSRASLDNGIDTVEGISVRRSAPERLQCSSPLIESNGGPSVSSLILSVGPGGSDMAKNQARQLPVGACLTGGHSKFYALFQCMGLSSSTVRRTLGENHPPLSHPQPQTLISTKLMKRTLPQAGRHTVVFSHTFDPSSSSGRFRGHAKRETRPARTRTNDLSHHYNIFNF